MGVSMASVMNVTENTMDKCVIKSAFKSVQITPVIEKEESAWKVWSSFGISVIYEYLDLFSLCIVYVLFEFLL